MAECDAIVVARHVLICPDVHALWVKIIKKIVQKAMDKSGFWPLKKF